MTSDCKLINCTNNVLGLKYFNSLNVTATAVAIVCKVLVLWLVNTVFTVCNSV